MVCRLVLTGRSLLCLHFIINQCLSYGHGHISKMKLLSVGEELKGETLPLQMGDCLYQLHGLKVSMWYEVKISYPASIPARFSIQLKSDNLDLGMNMKRKLLNTEKLIFKADDFLLAGNSDVYVLVVVEPEGIVAKPNVHEREHIIYNIVCDELTLGIPHKVLWVVVLALLCLGVALVIPFFLPPHLLPKYHCSRPRNLASSKTS